MPLSLAQIANIVVNLASPGISRRGFGTALVYSNTGNAWTTPELVRSYDISDDLTAVEADFAPDTVEYQAIAALAAQTPHPTTVLVGKGTHLPTGVKVVSISSVASETTYKINVYNDGVLWSAEHTTIPDETSDQIVEALVAKLSPDAWAALTNYSEGDRVTHDTGKIYECTVPGTSGGAATAGTETGSAGPFVVRPGYTTKFKIDGGGAQVWTWGGVAAKCKMAAAGAYVGNVPGTFDVAWADESGSHTTTITVPSGVAAGELALLAKLNELLATAGVPVFAEDSGDANKPQFTSTRFGTSTHVAITAVTGAGFTADTGIDVTAQSTAPTVTLTKSGGTGTKSVTVAFLDVTTATEADAAIALADDVTGATLSHTTGTAGKCTLTSGTTGTGSKVQADATSTALLGFDTAEHAGQAAGTGSGPTGTGQAITDGSVTWKYIATPNFTATVFGDPGSEVILCTGNAAGDWFTLEPIAASDPDGISDLMALEDTTALPSNMITDLTAILSANVNWYALIALFKSKALCTTASTGIAAWCESNQRLFVGSYSDTASATAADSGATDALHALKAAGGTYSAGQFHPRDYEHLDAATLGRFLPMSVGSTNWTYKPLSGIVAPNYSSNQLANLDARRASYYVELGSTETDVLAGKSKVSSTTYGYIDVRIGLDWFKLNLQADLVDLQLKADIIANTDAGRRKIATAISKRCQAGIDAGIISPDPLDPDNSDAASRIMTPFTVFVPPVTDATSWSASTRTLSGIKAAFKLANAILVVNVTVNVAQ